MNSNCTWEVSFVSLFLSPGAGCRHRGSHNSNRLPAHFWTNLCCCPSFCCYCLYYLLPLFSCSLPLPVSPIFLSAVLSLILLPSSFLRISRVPTCSLFPCHHLAFVISPGFFQQVLLHSSQMLTFTSFFNS